ncbi:hypothetical protein SAMN06297468_0559 [Altererythrobacter xiamenensis]|uniref:Uncharacterized protein n=1 Tax=Altererythrobacter xiamenensis TaxID=1316679 RepID=A0A1Y6EKI1_9SPHN|nr:hypothetical protein [Altererythrobacter xiamenensis]SMQ61430.1 hypothetical protein SAMN06297468_0559 [Altererythrobacter xiamenensis]
MRKLRTDNVVVCEYVAKGAHSKHTLVNVYTGDIIVREFPATFPLAFYIEIVPFEDLPEKLTFQVKKGRKVAAEIEVGFKYEKGKTALLTLPQIPITFTKNVDISVVAMGDGLQTTTVVKKKVSTGEIPSG